MQICSFFRFSIIQSRLHYNQYHQKYSSFLFLVNLGIRGLCDTNTNIPLLSIQNDSNSYSFQVIKEGKAEVLIHKEINSVFYNPAQCVNRDLSVAMIQEFINIRKQEYENQIIKNTKSTINQDEKQINEINELNEINNSFPGVNIFEALSASGLRSIRYFKELNGVNNIVVNDLDPNAFDSIRRNIAHNGFNERQLTPSVGDCSIILTKMREKGKHFDIIDIDPYGSAVPFLDASVQSINEGGLLCVTCTDMPVLCGKHIEVAYSKYATTPLREKYMHEMAIRIVLQTLNQTANRYQKYIEPLGCFFIDFYVRCFVRAYTSPLKVKDSPTFLSYIFQCVSCDTLTLQPIQKKVNNFKGNPKYVTTSAPIVGKNCEFCGGKHQIGGPIWNQPIFNKSFIINVLDIINKNKDIFAQNRKIIGLLTVASEELQDAPLFYTLSSLSSALRCQSPSASTVRQGLTNAGFEVSQSHCCAEAIKTNAPSNVIWDLMRTWVKSQSLNITEGSVAERILSTEPKIEIDFSIRVGDVITEKPPVVARFVQNPKNWGPKKAAGGGRFVKLKDQIRNISREKGTINENNISEDKTDENNDGTLETK